MQHTPDDEILRLLYKKMSKFLLNCYFPSTHNAPNYDILLLVFEPLPTPKPRTEEES